MKSQNTARKVGTHLESAVQAGSGNVFADLALPDAEEMLAKAQLAHNVGALIAAAKMTQAEAARRLGVDQPKISALLRGRLGGFSTDRLIRFLNALGQEVEIVIRPRPAGLPRDSGRGSRGLSEPLPHSATSI